MSYLYSYRDNLPQLLEEINLQKTSIKIPSFVTHDLVDTYQICRLLDDFIIEYFQENVKIDLATLLSFCCRFRYGQFLDN